MKERTDVERALEVLYGGGIRNLTAEGYNEAMRKLRKVDPSTARWVERMLGNVLSTRAFPRRGRLWYETSEGIRARLALLPGNPHVELDVRAIREALDIPKGQIHTTEDDPLWKDASALIKPQAVRRVVEGNLVGAWLHLHRLAVWGKLPEEKEGKINILPASLKKSAVNSARTRLDTARIPEWLRVTRQKRKSQHWVAAPIDLAATMLAQRHRIPLRLITSLTYYILTLDPSWITDLQPIEVVVAHSESDADPVAFTVTVKGIDELITKADWERIWSHYIKPRQDGIWRQRGMRPQGRRTVDIERLKKMLPLYRRIVLEGVREKYYFREVPEDWGERDLALDQETIRQAIRDLKGLLTPS